MTIEFQENVLRFLCTDKQGKGYLKLLDSSVFELAQHQLVFELLEKYLEEYKTLPKNSPNLVEFFTIETKKQKLPEEVYSEIVKSIKKVYDPYDNDVEIVKDSIVRFSQYKQTKLMFEEFAPKINEGPEVLEMMQQRMRHILNIGKEAHQAANRGGLLLAEHSLQKGFKITPGMPTFLKKLNKMTSAGGFYSPQLIIFMGAPKSFKTGTLLNIILEYVRDGYKVYWADTENGVNSMKNRFKQKIAEATLKELITGDLDDLLDGAVMKFKTMKGELAWDFFPAKKSTIGGDVKDGLLYYKDKYNFEPDIIVYDYLDLFSPSDKKITENRLKIQAVYHEAIALNVEYETVAFSISPVNKKAVNKEIIRMDDFGEDFAKAYNAHAAFAICRTEEEMKLGIARIVPVMQREGVPQGVGETCLIRIDAHKQSISEIDPREEARRLQKRVRTE